MRKIFTYFLCNRYFLGFH